MITYNNIAELSASQLVIGDVVMILGETSVGDRPAMFGVIQGSSFVSTNRVVDIAGGLKAEILPDRV